MVGIFGLIALAMVVGAILTVEHWRRGERQAALAHELAMVAAVRKVESEELAVLKAAVKVLEEKVSRIEWKK